VNATYSGQPPRAGFPLQLYQAEIWRRRNGCSMASAASASRERRDDEAGHVAILIAVYGYEYYDSGAAPPDRSDLRPSG
jgi:hypothetical protein